MQNDRFVHKHEYLLMFCVSVVILKNVLCLMTAYIQKFFKG